jgi:hypothetical protein
MLEIIIALLLALGVNTSEDGAIVIDQQTGIVFGVGTTTGFGNSTTNPNSTPVYILVQDGEGEYHLIRK